MNKKIFFILILLLTLVLYHIVFDTSCIIKAIIGIPCPSCGITRAWIYAINGNLKEALHFHPLFWIVIIIGILLLFRNKVSNKIWIGLLVLIIGTYVIRLIMYFPHTIPMEYNQNSLFSIVFNKIF